MSLDSNVVLRLVGMVIVRALDVRACLAWERGKRGVRRGCKGENEQREKVTGTEGRQSSDRDEKVGP